MSPQYFRLLMVVTVLAFLASLAIGLVRTIPGAGSCRPDAGPTVQTFAPDRCAR